MMNYPGVIAGEASILDKINSAKAHRKNIDGHAPFLSGKDLDKYVSAGIQTDHECTDINEALEKIRKGQWIMIREGTAAKNLAELAPLFDEPYSRRCLLVTDDRHPADLAKDGHIDNIIKLAVKHGKNVVTAIRMATIQAAQCFGLQFVGAVAPGYRADILVLDELEGVKVRDVYSQGKKVVSCGKVEKFGKPTVTEDLANRVLNSFNVQELSAKSFYIQEKSDKCRAIRVIPQQLITDEEIINVDWSKNNGIDIQRDILKLAVIERHHNTGHIGLGFICGIGLKNGAIASSVSHDSHNLIVIGTNDADMAIAANHIRKTGGNVVVADGKIISEMNLPIAGLMSDASAEEIATANDNVRAAVHKLGVCEGIEPFMNMAFVSLSVIPTLKMTTHGLVNVQKQELVSLYV